MNREENQEIKPLLSVSQLADHFSLHVMKIYRLLKKGKIKGKRVNRMWRFDLTEVEDFFLREWSKQTMLSQ